MVPEFPVWKIEREASELLEAAYPAGLPGSYIDIEWVIEEHCGLEIFPVPGLRSGWQTDGAFCALPDGGYSLAVDEDTMDHKPNRYRFTLGEELGHYVLHASYLPRVATVAEALALYHKLDNWDRMDRNARRFAAAVLMPMQTLTRSTEKAYATLVKAVGLADAEGFVKRLVAALAKVYGVSADAMKYRLKAYPARLADRIEAAIGEGLHYLP